MEVSSIETMSPATSTTETSASDALGQDTFLQLLVTQLKYQDPLNPMDSAQSLLQTAQFTMVDKLNVIADAVTGQQQFGQLSAVGSIVGQIAKRDGARVIGIAGGSEKCAHLVDELGFDEALDYKRGDLGDQLREACPDGVDVFFDNVGGDVLDAVLDNLAMHARVIICGAVSQYDDMDNVVGPSMYLRLAERQSRMEGFAYFQFPDDIPDAVEELSRWLVEGSIALPETVLEGIDRYPDALQFMFSGGNVGKLMVKA